MNFPKKRKASDSKKRNDIDSKIVNLLDLIPQRLVDIETDKQSQRIILLKPKFQNSFFLKYILPKIKHPHYQIKLDEFGSFVINHCDGKLTVRELGEKLKKKFGNEIDPLYERLSIFLHHLESHRFIVFRNIKERQE